jgi:long-chain acyl-CoA synthetase
MVKTFADPSFFSTYTEQERSNAKDLIDYSDLQTLPEIWAVVAKRHPNIVAVRDPHAKPEVAFTYTQLYERIQCFAAGLQALEVKPGNLVSLLSDNSPRWLIADQGIMLAGAVNAVRFGIGRFENLEKAA